MDKVLGPALAIHGSFRKKMSPTYKEHYLAIAGKTDSAAAITNENNMYTLTCKKFGSPLTNPKKMPDYDEKAWKAFLDNMCTEYPSIQNAMDAALLAANEAKDAYVAGLAATSSAEESPHCESPQKKRRKTGA